MIRISTFKFLLIFIFIFVFIGVVYSALTTSFGMSGTVEVSGAKYSISYTGSNVTFSSTSGNIIYGSTTTIKITPATGYYLNSLTCTNGYTTNALTGESAIATQTVTIDNNENAGNSTCTATMAKRRFIVTMEEVLNGVFVDSNTYEVEYGSDFTYPYKAYNGGNYLSQILCSNGYNTSTYKSGPDDSTAYSNQNITIYNNKISSDSTCQVYTNDTMNLYVEVVNGNGGMLSSAVGDELVESNVFALEIRYGKTEDFIVQPDDGYYLSDITCTLTTTGEEVNSSNYTLSSFSTNTIQDASRNNQTINITNNNYKGSVLCGVTFSRYEKVKVSVDGGAKLDYQFSEMDLYLDDNSDSFVVFPDSGYYLESVTCSSGYTASGFTTGIAAVGTTQTVIITSQNTTESGSCSVKMSNIYTVTLNVTNGKALINGNSVTSLTVPFAGTTDVVLQPNSGYYLSSISCTNYYTPLNVTTGSSTQDVIQTIGIFQNAQSGNSVCTVVFAKDS